MANNWNIPDWLEKEVRARDTECVYCRNEFTSAKVSRKSAASWEHIINDASKGQKQPSAWLQTKYCRDRGITLETVAPVIKQAIDRGLQHCT